MAADGSAGPNLNLVLSPALGVSPVLIPRVAATVPEENASSRGLNLLGRVLDQKRAAEAVLRESPLDWSIIRPGVLAPKQQGATLIFGGEPLGTCIVGEPGARTGQGGIG